MEKQSKTFRFGLSLGWRHLLTGEGAIHRDAVIDPTTNFVRVDSIDTGDVVLSGTLTVYPFATPLQRSASQRRSKLGFLANINIASFSSDNLGAFNKSIEGGFGLAWKLSEDFALGVTAERVFSRRLRSFIAPGQLLIINGDTIKTLSRDDGRFFKDDNLGAVSVKFLYTLR